MKKGKAKTVPPLKPTPLPEIEQYELLARRLSALTAGRLSVSISWSRDSYLSNDPESKGHLLSGRLECDNEEDYVNIDGRGEDAFLQLVKELRRIGRIYNRIADRVCRRIVEGG